MISARYNAFQFDVSIFKPRFVEFGTQPLNPHAKTMKREKINMNS